MGLDTSHDCWHGPYGGFARWREQIAELAGYTVFERQARFGGGRETSYALEWPRYTSSNYRGEWTDEQLAKVDDPLIFLLAHSDCDGEIRPAQAEPLAKRLRELIELMPESEPHAFGDDPKTYAQRFATGLEAAVAANETVEFH